MAQTINTTGNTDDVQNALTNFIQFIDPSYKWLVMDGDGEWRVHGDKPASLVYAWHSEGHEASLEGLTLPYDEHWKDSLIDLEELR